MATNAPVEAAPGALTFCREYVELAGDLAGIAKYFLIAALVLGVAYAVVEIIKKYREAPALSPRAVPGTGALKDLIDALKGFVEALAKAPAWLGLFAVGLVIFWGASASAGESCSGAMNQEYVTATSKPASADAGQASLANTSAPAGGSQSGTANGSETASAPSNTAHGR